MQTIIFEGIAGSGKTTLIEMLKAALADKVDDLVVVPEELSLMPLIANRDPDVAKRYIETLLSSIHILPCTTVIFERLLLTHLWRTKADAAQFAPVIDWLKQHNASIYLLEIPEQEIAKRISDIMATRGPDWRAYAGQRGDVRSLIKYYAEQQHQLRGMLDQGLLPYEVVMMTPNTFPLVIKAVVSEIEAHAAECAAARRRTEKENRPHLRAAA